MRSILFVVKPVCSSTVIDTKTGGGVIHTKEYCIFWQMRYLRLPQQQLKRKSDETEATAAALPSSRATKAKAAAIQRTMLNM